MMSEWVDGWGTDSFSTRLTYRRGMATRAIFAVSGLVPLQAVDPSTLLGAPAEWRAAASFLLTVVFGGAVIYRYGGRIDGAVDASMDRPLTSTLYGLMAYGLLLFATGYLFSQLAGAGLESRIVWIAFAAAFGAVVFSLCGYGFVVVGAWATDIIGTRDPWMGLVGVGIVIAVAWLLLPVILGAIVWFGVAALGIGGPTRLWIHEDVTGRTH